MAAAALLAGGSVLIAAWFAATRRMFGRPGTTSLLLALAAPLLLAGTCLGLDELITNQIRITGPVLMAMKTALRVGLFGGCLLLVQAVLTRLGEAVICSRRQLLTTHPRIDTESVRVRFVGYGAYSLDVEVFALATAPDWSTFLAIQEDVLLETMEVVRNCGFAFPSQTLYVATDEGSEAVRQVRRSAA